MAGLAGRAGLPAAQRLVFGCRAGFWQVRVPDGSRPQLHGLPAWVRRGAGDRAAPLLARRRGLSVDSRRGLASRAPEEEGVRGCPIAFRTGARQLSFPEKDTEVQTAYVVGGLYGNVHALDAIMEMSAGEAVPPLLVFNGDFNFFSRTVKDFVRVNAAIRDHPNAVATAGNVEYELSHSFGEAGCGCGYPSYVDGGVVSRSDEIVGMLGRAAQRAPPELVTWLASLPMHTTLRVGGCRVGVVHGDPASLAGWGLGVEMMEPLDAALRARLGVRDGDHTPAERVAEWFVEAGVDAFACTHTCLPFGQDWPSGAGGTARAIFNNGSAGIPNFEGRLHGLITRISSDLAPPPNSLYGCTLQGPGGGRARIDAVPVDYDQAAFRAWFERTWPQGSPAHTSYYSRICGGPSGFTLAHANRLAS